MKITQTELSSRLLYLPIDLKEKVLLWLTYKGLKPVSEITTSRRGNLMSLLRRGIKRKPTYDFNSRKSERIKKWLLDAGLYFRPESEGDMSWHVGKDKDNVELSSEIIRKFDYDNELKSGLLFGFPEKSAKAYAHNRIAPDNEQIPMVWPDKENYFIDKYYAPYVLFNTPLEHADKDGQTAKMWADTIRKDVPKLAEWFERDEERRRKKQEKTLQKAYNVNLLVVCSHNKWRSPTAEKIYRHYPRIRICSAGLSKISPHFLSHKDIMWANLLLYMESDHLERIKILYPDIVLPKTINLDIPDEYPYMDSDLIDIIKEKFEIIIENESNTSSHQTLPRSITR